MKRRRERGIALLMVTWVFMILGVLALDFARYMRDDAMAALNLSEETRHYYVAVGAINRAIYDLEEADREASVEPASRKTLLARGEAGLAGSAGALCAAGTDGAACQDDDDEGEDDEDDGDDAADGDEEDDDGILAADGEWHEDVLGETRYGVRVTDEGALISLNDAAQEVGGTLLRHVVKTLLGFGGTAGIDRRGEAAVSTVVDSIVDWYDPNNDEGPHGAENRFYLDREPSYPAKNGDFDSIEELLLLRGMTRELYYGSDGMPGMKDVFSPYIHSKGEHPKVSLRRTTPAVLQALLGIDAEEAAELIELREEQEPLVFETQVLERLRTVDPVLAEQINKGGSPKVVRVEARADVSQPRNQARVAAVIELSSELTEGIRIIRWFDRAPWQGGLPAGTGDEPA